MAPSPKTLAASLVALSMLTTAGSASAQPLDDRAGVFVDLPAVDLPFNTSNGYTFPSMAQSLALSSDVYQLAHFGIGAAIDPYGDSMGQRIGGRLAISAADFLLTYLPGGMAWQHEEWHRATLSRRGISSFNDVYRFKLFANIIAVSKVDDGKLADFKRDRPAEYVRMSTAGIEGNYELATQLEKHQVFYRTRAWHGFALWQLYLTNVFYVGTCASKSADEISDEEAASAGTDRTKLDFTGLDCTAYTHDLYRPSAPYGPSRGSVNGRYIARRDLDSNERSYLRNQLYLSLLNFLDPALLGIDWFDVSSARLRFSAHVRHQPTSFGQATSLEAMLARGDLRAFASLIGYSNRDTVLPGLSAEIHRFPLDLVIGLPIDVSPRIGLWLQPSAQRFEGAKVAPGGLAALRLGLALRPEFEPWIEVEGKSNGWVAGNVYLDANVSFRAGVSAALFGDGF